jgi:hypothetical protein
MVSYMNYKDRITIEAGKRDGPRASRNGASRVRLLFEHDLSVTATCASYCRLLSGGNCSTSEIEFILR